MAAGDAVCSDVTSISDTAYMTIQPGAGVEWVIHNISVPNDKAVELYYYNGTNEIKVDANTGGWIGYFFHCNNTRYYRVKNVSGGAVYMAYDGMQTK